MELLVRQPEHTTLVSVGHRPELELFHTRKIVLERRRGGTRLVSDIHLEEGHSRGLLRSWLQRNTKVGNRDAKRDTTTENQILESPTLAPK
jgi:putative ATP-binding cassette transporter